MKELFRRVALATTVLIRKAELVIAEELKLLQFTTSTPATGKDHITYVIEKTTC